MKERLASVDAVRGVAIVFVALYHLIYDLDNLAGYPIASTTGFWGAFADFSAFMFVFLVGVSLSLSFSRAQSDGLFLKYLRRGLRIFAYGMLVTLVFWALDFGWVIFGILQLIGVSIVLAYPFMRLRYANLILGMLLVAVGAYLQIAGVSSDSAWLAPLGIAPEGLFMPDYRPLVPWFGVVLLGLFTGNVVLEQGKRIPTPAKPGPLKPLAFLGRHTLFVYLVHQPVIVASLAALGIVEFGVL
jgi:uncharacterized membrane protein